MSSFTLTHWPNPRASTRRSHVSARTHTRVHTDALEIHARVRVSSSSSSSSPSSSSSDSCYCCYCCYCCRCCCCCCLQQVDTNLLMPLRPLLSVTHHGLLTFIAISSRARHALTFLRSFPPHTTTRPPPQPLVSSFSAVLASAAIISASAGHGRRSSADRCRSSSSTKCYFLFRMAPPPS